MADNNQILMRPSRVKNMSAAEIQVTSEQLLLDSQIHVEKIVNPPQQRLMDKEELDSYKLRKRKEFEDNLRMQRHHIGTWIKYALWEEGLKEFTRARSIFERTLEINYQNPSVWLKYVEMEMRNKFVNHARNIWERAVTYLPRVDQFWYKYTYMEEMLGNYTRSRELFERWMNWRPEEKGWLCYIKFEQRLNEPERCREIMYRYLQEYPKQATYLKVARFEMKALNIQSARLVFEKTAEDLGVDALDQEYYINFAKFELRNREQERAREIFKFGLERLEKSKSNKLYDSYLTFEKQFGTKDEVDSLILEKRRSHYKSQLEKNQLNYDTWFDLINLELCTKNHEKIRETFELAVVNTPPAQEKRFWRRYIYIWYNYAIFEEIDANDAVRAQEVYERAIKLVPHQQFTFSKLWILTAHLHLRCQNLDKARKTLGVAIGKCPNVKIFKAYIDMELQLANIDRCRSLYEKFISVFPTETTPWIKYAELEISLDEIERARELFELAIQQTEINMPETLWMAYIETEIQLKENENVRNLYERLLQKTKHVKVWISYAQFEFQIQEKFREVYSRADTYFKENPDMKEERVMLLESWRQTEQQNGDQENIDVVSKKLPKKVKKQRRIKIQDDEAEEDAGWEEYYDYIFPDDQNQLRNLKILQKAYKWKNKEQPQ